MKRRRNLLFLLAVVAVVSILLGACLANSQSTDSGDEEESQSIGSADDDICLDCHSNAGRLISLLRAREEPATEEDTGSCAVAPGRSEFLNYFVKKDFATSTHGQLGCSTCHGGNTATDDLDEIHADIKSGGTQCAECHAEIVDTHETSIHWTLAGQDESLRMRAGTEENFFHLEPVRQNDCNTCHATCGDCHINIPQAVGGGLISGHEFYRTPPMEDTCAVCHGSRAGGEFLGTLSEELPADVHFEAGMTCLDCHKEPMHGDGNQYVSRWDVEGLPQCVDCHEAVSNSQTAAHSPLLHDAVSCQVCHAVAYKNCSGCHSSIDENGQYKRVPEEVEFVLKIGYNTVPGYPYEYVTVRHNPVDRDTFAFFGENLLPDFDDYPNWKTAAPHNIQRSTPQNETCESCHANEQLFLMESDLDPDDPQANRAVTIEKMP
ncbi:hypothetical protein KAJ02_03625 [Candidatus Bipolaricaulota bacterium]|nr:hypothetical protein [Candidatus Bipolaricaulota bacterium]